MFIEYSKGKRKMANKLSEKIMNYLNPNSKIYWDNLYTSELNHGKIRQDRTILKLLSILGGKKNILDFGSGPGGNVKLLSQHLKNTNFTLLDHSTQVIDYAKHHYLLECDENKNTFNYFTDLSQLPKQNFDAILSIEVFEHLKNYSEILEKLWELLNENGILIISVPVKGIRDRQREHINKFTINSMFKILSKYSNWVSISPRTYSGKSGILSTAFFYIIKNNKE